MSPKTLLGYLRRHDLEYTQQEEAAVALSRTLTAAQALVDAYQPHVMEERCRVCTQAWNDLRRVLEGGR